MDTPEKLRPLTFQVAGHASDSKYGVLQNEDGKLVYKPEQNAREREFYAKVFSENCDDSAIAALRQFIPKYYGSVRNELSSDGISYIKLENIVAKFCLPSIMDVRIGKITTEPDAPIDKVMRHRQNYKDTKEKLGFSIPGIKVYNQTTMKYDVYDREYGLSLNADTVKNAMKIFLNIYSKNAVLMNSFVQHLSQIRHWFYEQRCFHFYSCSILLVYESSVDNSQRSEIEIANATKIPCDVKMIDFVHVINVDDSRDDNYLFGLDNLIRTLRELNS